MRKDWCLTTENETEMHFILDWTMQSKSRCKFFMMVLLLVWHPVLLEFWVTTMYNSFLQNILLLLPTIYAYQEWRNSGMKIIILYISILVFNNTQVVLSSGPKMWIRIVAKCHSLKSRMPLWDHMETYVLSFTWQANYSQLSLQSLSLIFSWFSNMHSFSPWYALAFTYLR